MTEQTVKAIGRPSIMTVETMDAILEKIGEGKSLRSICAEDDMPSKSTVLRCLAQDEEFRAQYAHARDLQADTLFDEILSIADDAGGDFAETDKGPAFNAEHVQRSRLRVDARKWMASKLAPKKYGDKLGLEHSGGLSLHELVTGSMKPPE